MTDNPDSDDDKVGYGRPPKHSQFKPGETGNPNGRPKGSRNFRTDVRSALKKPVTFTESGKRRKTSTQLATILKLREKALHGDARALDRMVELATRYNDEPAPGRADAPLPAGDAEIVAAFLARQIPAPERPSSPVGGSEAAASTPVTIPKDK